jgi:hypothetical protein
VSRARFEKPCEAAPARAIERAVRHLLAMGYGLEEQSDSEAELVYLRGSTASVALDAFRHKLEIASDGKSLRFHFHSGLGASGYLTKKERAKLEERADGTAIAARDPEVKDTSVNESFRCRYCRALTPLGKATCQSCGADNFS